MPIVTDGPMLEPLDRDVRDYGASRTEALRANIAEAWAENPLQQIRGMAEQDRAAGRDIDFGEIATGFPTPGGADRPAPPMLPVTQAKERVKKAGLDLKLPEQGDIAEPELAIMMDRARARREHEATIARGPDGVVQTALSVGTSFLVGAVDPINVAASFIPVIGELRYGKLMAGAGESALARAGVRAGVGAASGVVGQAAIEPLSWMGHTQEGRDYTAAEVMRNLLFGAVLGGSLHAGGGLVADVWRGRQGRPVFPYDVGEPGEYHTPFDELRTPRAEPAAGLGEFPGLDRIHAPSPIETILDLPPRAQEDAMRAGIADLIEGRPVGAAELVDAAAKTDPRIAESFDRPADRINPAARQAVYDDVHAKLLAAGMDEEHAAANAAVWAARYAARAERLGGAGRDALDLYRGEGVEIRAEDAGGAGEGRSFDQPLRLVDAPEGGVYTPDQIKADKGERYFKAMDRDGNVVAEMLVRIDGNTARIEDVLNPAAPREAGVGTVGVLQLRRLLQQLQERYPDVTRLTGKRVSGARMGGDYSLTREASEISIDLPPSRRPQQLQVVPGERSFNQSAPQKPRTKGIPAAADPPVSSHVTTQDMKAHPDYEAAKRGDVQAAARLVTDLVKPETIEAARTRFGKDAVYVPVHAEEASGKNKIPMLLAHYYAESTGAQVDASIVQASRAYHTGASAVERLIARPRFDGPVQPGKRYVIVDDVSVMGNTLAELAHHIQEGGGEVAGIVTLVNQSRMAHNAPKPARTRLLEDKFGQVIRDELGVDPGSLTAAETEYLLNFRDADSLRDRLAKARRERVERLRAKGVRPSEAEGQLEQAGGEGPRGRITLSDNRAVIDLFQSANPSTFMHESGHLWLDELMRDAATKGAPAQLVADRDAVLNWLGVKDASGIGVAEHEQWARGFETYLATGEAPSNALARAFEQFKRWLTELYQALSGARQEISPEIRGVMDRLLATDREITAQRALTEDASGIAGQRVATGPRGRAAADPKTWSLFEYLASKGGLKADPELEAIFGGRRAPMIPGFGPLVRRNGMTLDEALRAAKDGHYMFDPADVTGAEAKLTPNDLLDALARENRRQKVYRYDTDVGATIDRDHEAKVIADKLLDEIEATTGQKGVHVDPALMDRVVEIVQKEGETDVLAAYERAIMEDADRYEELARERQQHSELSAIAGWDHPDGGAASRDGAVDSGQRGQAGLSAEGPGSADGGQSSGSGAGDRGTFARSIPPERSEVIRARRPREEKDLVSPEAAAAARQDAWSALAARRPDYDRPEAVQASQAAAAAPDGPAPTAPESEKLKALLEAEARSAEIYAAKEAFLAPEERARVEEQLRLIDVEANDRREITAQGAACLARGYGIV